MAELLSPVGDFDCLKAAVQNGADAVYFGSNLFSARAFAKNFDTDDELEKAINYAKLRGVKTHLTLNTLIKDDEFENAFNVAKKAYELGIDAIIVQDLGLATELIKAFPDLDIHASTQMTSTNIEQVKKLQQIGFKRVVLSRECSLTEIKNICQNTNVEIEVFIHGALCICYSGQCLFSSMVGGRSGNRGKCAQPCRLPYSLVFENNKIDNGYILSPRDLCTLDLLPDLISSGVASFKIEGRMKSPTYVATVTRIYRKYIDLATKYINKEISEYIVDEKDRLDLMQVFNRGKFSSGHLLDEPNKKLIYPQKPNNMGIYLGKISKYNPNKGHITVKLENNVSIGDGISFENENTTYTISELITNNNNLKTASSGKTVTFGRMKGNIKVGDGVYKITDKELFSIAQNSYNEEYKKSYLSCKVDIHSNKNICVYIKSLDFDIEEKFEFEYIPNIAKNAPITKEKIETQFRKTLNTCFEFSNIEVNIGPNLFIPVSTINEIRRQCISKIEEKILKSFKRTSDEYIEQICFNYNEPQIQQKSVLLNALNVTYDYSSLDSVDRIYIPLKYFCDNNYSQIINILSQNSKLYIYMPVVIKDRFYNSINDKLKYAFNKYNISGCVISELSSIKFFENIQTDLIANYNFNVFNSLTAKQLKNLGFSLVTVSPELDSAEQSKICIQDKESIVYGKIPLMTMSYCLLGKTNRCYKECKQLCLSDKNFYLNDRYNFKFRIIPDNTQTLTTVYNSRNLELSYVDSKSIRFDFLDENIEEINNIINQYRKM